MPAPDDERARATPGAEADGFALMAQGAGLLIEGVARLGPAWVVRAVTRLVDVWGKLDAAGRAGAIAAATAAGEQAAVRVETELRSLFELDPAAQRATPLEIIRSLRREASDVL